MYAVCIQYILTKKNIVLKVQYSNHPTLGGMRRLFKADYREKADVLSSNRLISDGARSQHLAVMRHLKKKNEFLTCAPSSDINFKHRSSGDTHESWRPLHETDAVSEIAVSWWWPEGDNCSHICTLEAPWSLTEVSHCTLFIWMPSFDEKRAERSCGIPLSYTLNTVELDRRQIEAGVKFFCCLLKATRYMLQICATTNRFPARPHWSPLGKRGHSAVNNLME